MYTRRLDSAQELHLKSKALSAGCCVRAVGIERREVMCVQRLQPSIVRAASYVCSVAWCSVLCFVALCVCHVSG